MTKKSETNFKKSQSKEIDSENSINDYSHHHEDDEENDENHGPVGVFEDEFEKQPVEPFWDDEKEVVISKERGPLNYGPITNPAVSDQKQPVNIMGENFLRHYIVTRDVRNYIYIYNGKYWEETSVEYLRSLAMQFDTDKHSTLGRRKAVVDYALDRSQQKYIHWNQIGFEEIAFRDCLYDIKTGERKKHSWKQYLSNIIPHKLDMEALCPTWERCLDDWFETEDKKLALQEFFGYILCLHARYKTALLLLGESDAGKSVPCNIAKEIVGERGYVSIGLHQMDNPQLIAPLKGVFLNIVTEISKDAVMADGGFKQITANEPIQVNPKFFKPETIVPFAKHMIATNNLPEIHDDSNGVYARLLIIKFNKVIEKAKKDKYLEIKLIKELPGIIAWSVRGAKRLINNNGQFTEIKESVTLLREYKTSQNPILSFVEESEVVEKDPNGKIATDIFRREFEKYKGGKEWKPITIGKKLKHLGYPSESCQGQRYYKGIKMKQYRFNGGNGSGNTNNTENVSKDPF